MVKHMMQYVPAHPKTEKEFKAYGDKLKKVQNGDTALWDEVEPYRVLARCILAIFQKYPIFAQF